MIDAWRRSRRTPTPQTTETRPEVRRLAAHLRHDCRKYGNHGNFPHSPTENGALVYVRRMLLLTSQADWWLDVGLQGVIGSIIGGLITLLAVLITLWVERGRGEHRAIESDCQHLLQANRRLRHLALSESPEFSTAWYWDWNPAITQVQSRAGSRYPCFGELLGACQEILGSAAAGTASANGLEVKDMQGVLRTVQNVEKITRYWLTEPTAYRKLTREQCDTRVRRLREGWFL